MNPYRHHLCNDTLLRPPGTTEEQCGDLPIRRQQGGVISFWRPTPEEVRLIAKGEPVMLIAQGTTHPPVCLLVQELSDESKPSYPPQG